MANFGFDKLRSRRKSAGTAIDDAQNAQPGFPDENTPPPSDQSSQSTGFRVMTQAEAVGAKRAAAEKKQEKPKFVGRFSGGRPFSSPGQKSQRQHSFEDDSGASYRESNASGSTNYSATKPYGGVSSTWGTYGSSDSTLRSSPDEESDNMFANMTPPDHQRKNSGHTFSLVGGKKARTLFSSHKSSDSDFKAGVAPGFGETQYPEATLGNRARAMTASSYASTAVPPRVDAELPIGTSDFSSSFDDMFSGIGRKSPGPAIPSVPTPPTGRPLLANRRTLQPEPIQINSSLVDPSPKSWESRDEGDRLIAASPSEYDSPPPVPPHKTTVPRQVANGQTLRGYTNPNIRRSSTSSFEDEDAKMVRQSVAARKSIMASSPELNPHSTSSSSAVSHQTPLSSRSTSNNTTPKALSRVPLEASDDEDDDNMFDFTKKSEVKKPLVTAPKVEQPYLDASIIASANAARKFTESEPPRKVMTQEQFKKQQQLAAQQPAEEDSEEEDLFDDEDEAEHIRKQQEIRRKQEAQMAMHREIMRKSTAPGELSNANRSSSTPGLPLMGYPSEMFINKPDDDDDEDIPLAILQQHGFPNRSRPPTKPQDAAPSYFRQSTMGMPERPASAGSLGQGHRASTANLPAFARNLPADPYFGAGLVRPSNRESLGFGANPMSSSASVYGGPAGTPSVPPGGLVGVIQEEERAKKIRRGGGATSTYGFGSTFGQGQQQMPPMMQQPSMMNMHQFNPMMQQPSMMNMQQAMMQQMMMQQYGMMGNPQMMSPGGGMMGGFNTQELAQEVAKQMMAMQLNGGQMPSQPQQQMGGMPGMNMPPQQNQRPMSIASRPNAQRMSTAPGMLAPPQMGRPFSTPAANSFGMPSQTGYTPSIAPTERSTVGQSARYRPVVTHHDGVSSESSQTMQAMPGATDTAQKRMTIKSILKPVEKKQSPEEGGEWGKLGNRRSKWLAGGKKKEDNSFKDLYGGLGGVTEE